MAKPRLPLYSTAAVAMQTRVSAASDQCTTRSARLNLRRSSVGTEATEDVTGPPLAPYPPVDVVPTGLPVSRDLTVRQLDPRQPLGALVAIVGGHVHAHRTPVVVCHRGTEHAQGHEDAWSAGLLERQALGVGAVEGPERHRG